mmetsp:Transcript_16429/g.36483  ORF Transcript_16429/g.36483 Transcript_16429/m.36483 type:complete len:85 (-) Transcript_16429:272-526(-)
MKQFALRMNWRRKRVEAKRGRQMRRIHSKMSRHCGSVLRSAQSLDITDDERSVGDVLDKTWVDMAEVAIGKAVDETEFQAVQTV